MHYQGIITESNTCKMVTHSYKDKTKELPNQNQIERSASTTDGSDCPGSSSTHSGQTAFVISNLKK